MGFLQADLVMMGPASLAERNLVLVHQHGAQAIGDLEKLAEIVRRKAADIEVFIVSNDSASPVTRRKAAQRPALVFSPIYLRYFEPGRGKVYAGQLLSKQQQMQRFIAAGLPVPYFWHPSLNAPPDRDQLGDYLLAKPAFIGASQGAGIALMRTGTALQKFAALGDVFLQRFIDTGLYPSHYRVFTIFGRPVLAYKNSLLEPRGTLDVPDEELGKVTIRARRGTKRTKTLCDDADVLALGADAWRAIPEVPFQACDIVREAATGALYLLEINPGGNTWIFSRKNTPKVIEELGGIDLTSQFNAFETMADALIERTRAEAQ
jgi:hypothetical protein